MHRPGWINAGQVFEMRWRDAQPYWGADSTMRKSWKLDDPSIHALLQLSSSITGITILVHPISRTAATSGPLEASTLPQNAASSSPFDLSGRARESRVARLETLQIGESSRLLPARNVGMRSSSTLPYNEAPELESATAHCMGSGLEHETQRLITSDNTTPHRARSAKKQNGRKRMYWHYWDSQCESSGIGRMIGIMTGLVMVAFAGSLMAAVIWQWK